MYCLSNAQSHRYTAVRGQSSFILWLTSYPNTIKWSVTFILISSIPGIFPFSVAREIRCRHLRWFCLVQFDCCHDLCLHTGFPFYYKLFMSTRNIQVGSLDISNLFYLSFLSSIVARTMEMCGLCFVDLLFANVCKHNCLFGEDVIHFSGESFIAINISFIYGIVFAGPSPFCHWPPNINALVFVFPRIPSSIHSFIHIKTTNFHSTSECLRVTQELCHHRHRQHSLSQYRITQMALCARTRVCAEPRSRALMPKIGKHGTILLLSLKSYNMQTAKQTVMGVKMWIWWSQTIYSVSILSI